MRRLVIIAVLLAALAGAGTAAANIPGDNGAGMCLVHYAHNPPFYVPCY